MSTVADSTTPFVAPAAVGIVSGKVIAVREGRVVFAASNTNYETELVCLGYAGPVNKPVKGIIRVKARKVWTVPSGGAFVTPLFGPPKIIQGRVRAVEPKSLVVHAGVAITVDLPDDDIVYDLANGPIAEGAMVNVTAFAGGTFELR